MSTPFKSVLIAGAGPTGLVLALWLTKIGIKVRLIDKAEKAGTTSRALVVHARTLEFYRQLGISNEVLAKGFKFPKLHLWVGQQIRAELSIGELGQDATPFPYVVIFPQDQHEEFLISHLKTLGVEVERNTELLSFEATEQAMTATLKLPSGKTEQFSAAYLAGCDGARSRVREQLGLEFEGSTYPDLFYVADISGKGEALNGDLHVSLDEADFLGIFPMKNRGHARLIGVIREKDDGRRIEWKDVNPHLIKVMQIQVDQVNWFSTYHVHHRVAAHLQVGRVFLLGDAGHIHSPVGGQGMNTGVGDAVNLAWKLGEVLKGKASPELLKSYEPERIAFARLLVKTSDRAFKFISSQGPIARIVRTKIFPNFMPFAVRFAFVKRFLFRTLSQTGISYRHCDINEGKAGKLSAGDRLPWIESVDNFESLQSLDWQIHVYGDRILSTQSHSYPIFQFPWNTEMARKGLVKNKIYLIRPDGYIGKIVKEVALL